VTSSTLPVLLIAMTFA